MTISDLIPDPAVEFVGPDRRIATAWQQWIRRVSKTIGAIDATVSQIQATPSADSDDDDTTTFVFAAKTQDFSESILIEVPDDKDYEFLSVAFVGTITGVTAKCSAGTCTVTVLVDGVALNGSANSVTTTESTEVHDTDVATGKNWIIRVSSNASSENLSVAITGTQTFA